MRPDKQIRGLSARSRSGDAPNAYVRSTRLPGPVPAIVGEDHPVHMARGSLHGEWSASVAHLYFGGEHRDGNPAVTMRSVGSGQAVAFTYDLARSGGVHETRESGLERPRPRRGQVTADPQL